MASLDYKKYVPAKLDVVYERQIEESAKEQQITTPTSSRSRSTRSTVTNAPSSEELDQELEDLLLAMGGTDIPQHAVIDEAEFVDPVVEKVEWLNPDDLVDPKEFNYQPTPTDRSKYDQVPTCSSNKFNYQARRDSSSRLNSDYSSTTDRFNYSPSNQNNCNYQADHSSSKFDYQSDQDSSSKFSHVPTANNDRFDYQFTNPTKFDRSIPTVNRYPSVPCNNNSSQSRDQSILDVEVDQNTRVRLEVGVSATVGNDSARAAAYAKATIYRRG